MDKQTFRYRFQDVDAVQLTESIFLFRKPLRLVDYSTDPETVTTFPHLDRALSFVVESVGQTVEAIIAGMVTVLPVFDGGGGGDSGMDTFSFGHAGSEGGGEPLAHFPVEANVRIKAKSEAGALEEFAERFQMEDHEFLYLVDEQGYVHDFTEGNEVSVAPTKSARGMMVLHNHPSGGAFSDSDLISTAMTGAKGIVAAGKDGDYILKTGSHFKAQQFVRAVKKAKMKGKDYDDAVRRWLGDKNRQKQFGYTFRFNKATDRNYVQKDRAAQNKRARQISAGGLTYRITGVQADMTGKNTVTAAQVYKNGKWQAAKMTSSLSATLTRRYGER